ncbi:MAG: CDP-alcohol phosphatidyltransferase family protein [Deltaproteobacteria bacterium]|nr:CDP-alcohol phosphatidyltransferase family protein [Deltaproteobacteria bacterium]
MCHPWLAAGVAGFLGVVVTREVVPVLRREERDAPLAQGLLGTGLRTWFRGRLDPLVDALLAAGIRADWVTAVQFGISGLCGVAYARGWLFTAGWLLLTGGTLDVLDGAMARKCGAASARGAFVDSVVDRYGECVVFLGLAVHLRDGWALWAVLAAAFGAFMVSYTRARGEGLGVACAIGLLQRPERYVIIGGGSLIGSLAAHLTCAPAAAYGLLVGGVLAVAVLANVTALQRAAAIVRQLA